MPFSLFLAKVIGLYLLVVGAAVLINIPWMVQVVKDFARERALIFVSGLLSLFFGLLLIVSHNVWTQDWRVLITLLGWIALIRGIMRLFFPEVVMGWLKSMATERVLLIAGVIIAVLGGVLTYYGCFTLLR